ncbi:MULTISPECIES: SRPBCC family protein [Actinokineospora]|uniref:Polyketide cyclase n=1 Tax=Actinokineospora fastidiosa TaxID=1816 RepID=A0A918GJA2_9PSEU|nr:MULTISPECIES: SRPBCC family protein [Actinokineospora]UVS80668.1 Polyketide cyclase / dehydrase and lipid transport [Actinokineospora sp. UTMC 2448]GGS36382.1 polyketide cyclase [Actinokineospora fastidiosa]
MRARAGYPAAMAAVSKEIPVPIDRVWAVLADGWTYASWVVGASHIRRVDSTWPAEGSGIHHSVGLWPLVINDVTRVRAVRPGEMVELDARLWPVGAATVRLELFPTATGTRVVMTENARSGPAAALPERAQDLMLVPRNKESLERLCALAARKTD